MQVRQEANRPTRYIGNMNNGIQINKTITKTRSNGAKPTKYQQQSDRVAVPAQRCRQLSIEVPFHIQCQPTSGDILQ